MAKNMNTKLGNIMINNIGTPFITNEMRYKIDRDIEDALYDDLCEPYSLFLISRTERLVEAQIKEDLND